MNRSAVAWLQPRLAYAVPLLRTRIDRAALGKGAFSWRLISILLDPAKPESRSLWVLGGLLLGADWVPFSWLCWTGLKG